MPNHVTNRLEINADRETVQKVMNFLKGKTDDDNTPCYIDFNNIIPMPEELLIEKNSSGDFGMRCLEAMQRQPFYFLLDDDDLRAVQWMRGLAEKDRQEALQLGETYLENRKKCKYSINSLVYWVTYVHNVVYSFYRSMIYCYINSTQRCAGSIVIDIIPTNGADKRKFFPFAPYFPVTNVIKRYFYPYFPAIIGIKGYSFPYFPYLSGIMKIKTALYSLFSRLDWHKTVVFPCLGEIYEGIRSLSWEIPVT